MISEQAAFLSPVDMMIVMVVALVVFGPAKLPEVGRQLGQAIRELKKLTSDLTDSINHETTDIRSAFDATPKSSYQSAPIEPKIDQSVPAGGYIIPINEPEQPVQPPQLPGIAAGAEQQHLDQTGAAAVPLTATVEAKTGGEVS